MDSAVERQKSQPRAEKFGDVPTPDLIQAGGQQLRFLVVGMTELIAVVAKLAGLLEDAVLGADRARVGLDHRISTYPSFPCTGIRCPSLISSVAFSTPTTAGKPYSPTMTLHGSSVHQLRPSGLWWIQTTVSS